VSSSAYSAFVISHPIPPGLVSSLFPFLFFEELDFLAISPFNIPTKMCFGDVAWDQSDPMADFWSQSFPKQIL
jgi:hypothetical protein